MTASHLYQVAITELDSQAVGIEDFGCIPDQGRGYNDHSLQFLHLQLLDTQGHSSSDCINPVP
jgi:hypothetical protein